MVLFRVALRVGKPEQRVAFCLCRERFGQRVNFSLFGGECDGEMNGLRLLRLAQYDNVFERSQLGLEGRRRVDDDDLALMLQIQFVKD